jgi:HPt (histidine-containing phosphotransfer) domain-containing protein
MMTDKVIDHTVFQTLVEAVGEDFVGEMVDAFLEEGRQIIADLNSAFADQNVDRFRRAAHSLKSTAATFGAMTLSALAKELEAMARENQIESAMDKLEPISVAFANAKKALKELQNG